MQKVLIKGIIPIFLMVILLIAIVPPAFAAGGDDTLKAGLYTRDFKTINALVRPSYNQLNEMFGVTHIGLASFNPDLSPNPCLAKSWDVAPDGNSITFHLVDNVLWHDGTPVTADDVKFTYEYWRDNHLYRQGGWLNDYLDNVEVLDNSTGVIHLKKPYAYNFVKSLFPSVYIVPKHIWEKVEVPREYTGADAMVGCGPYIFTKYDPDADAEYFKSNPDYFEGKPSIDYIEWKHYRNVDSMLLALKKGDIDLIIDEPPAGVLAPSLLGERDVTVDVGQNPGLPLLIFNYKREPLDNVEFRKAFSYAIDYQSLVNAVEAGYGEIPGAGIIPSGVVEYDPSIPKLEYNPGKANEILDTMGYKDTNGDGIRNLPNGSELKFNVIAWSSDKDMRVAEMLSQMMKKVGIDLEPYTNEMTTLQKMVWDDRDYDMHIDFEDPYMVALNFALIDLIPEQYGTCQDPVFEELYKKVMSATNENDLKSAVYELQHYYADQLPGIPLYWSKSIYPYRSDRFVGWVPLEGYGLTSHGSLFNVTAATT